MLHVSIRSNSVYLEDVSFKMHYLEVDATIPSNEVILMIHGWPTSSFLYRKMMPPLSKHHRVIAIDLPGFGGSDKDPKASLSFRYHANIIQAFVEKLELRNIHLMVHDLGGPIGLWWAQKHVELIKSYVILDTLVYPKFSRNVKIFVAMSLLPIARSWLSSSRGIRWSMKFGIYNKSLLTVEILEGYTSPYSKAENEKLARKTLLKSASHLHIKGFHTIVENLKNIKQPTCLIYAENDKILPKVADTVSKIAQAIIHAEVHSIPNCGHFLQEEKPKEIVEILDPFYRSMNSI